MWGTTRRSSLLQLWLVISQTRKRLHVILNLEDKSAGHNASNPTSLHTEHSLVSVK